MVTQYLNIRASRSAVILMFMSFHSRLRELIFHLLTLMHQGTLNLLDLVIYYVMNASLVIMILFEGVEELCAVIVNYVSLIQKLVEHGTFSHIN